MIDRGAKALIKANWSSYLQYRSFFFVLAFGWMIPPLIYLFVWSAAAGENSVLGIERGTFTAYYILLILVNQFTYAQTNWTVGDLIRLGMLNYHLVRPIRFIYQVLSDEIAGKVVFMLFVIPVSIVLAFILKPVLHPPLSNILFSILSLVLAWWLRFLWGLWLALLAFWLTKADALLAVQDALTFIFAGIVAPISLLPDILNRFAVWLPFRYMVCFPVEILTGQVNPDTLISGLLIQAGWLSFAVLLCTLIWKRGLKHYAAFGG